MGRPEVDGVWSVDHLVQPAPPSKFEVADTYDVYRLRAEVDRLKKEKAAFEAIIMGLVA